MLFENEKLKLREVKEKATEMIIRNCEQDMCSNISSQSIEVILKEGNTIAGKFPNSDDMSGFTQLSKLNISCPYKMVRNITILKEVNIAAEKCNTILKDLSNNTSLTTLQINGAGEINAESIAVFKNLENLIISCKPDNISSQRLRGIPIPKPQLSIVNTDALQCLTKLKSLVISGNVILDSLNFINKLSSLEAMDMIALELDKLPSLKGLNYLNKLRVGAGTIDSLEELCNVPQLQAINIQHNRISDLTPLSKLEQLEVIELNDNLIKDISPLSSLKKLYYVSVENNLIENISPLSKLTSLESIYTNGNPCC